jgi:hypothetical protein
VAYGRTLVRRWRTHLRSDEGMTYILTRLGRHARQNGIATIVNAGRKSDSSAD